MIRGLSALLLIFCFCSQLQAQGFYPFQPPAPETCIEVVKSFLSSSEYNGAENIDRIRGACLNVETRCVQLVGDSLSSSERREAATFLPVVRGCVGQGKADCYSDILATIPSFDRSTAAQAKELLKKCEPKP